MRTTIEDGIDKLLITDEHPEEKGCKVNPKFLTLTVTDRERGHDATVIVNKEDLKKALETYL